MKKIVLIVCVISVSLSLIGCTKTSNNSSIVSTGTIKPEISTAVTEQALSEKEESKDVTTSSPDQNKESSSIKETSSSKKSSTSSKKTTSKNANTQTFLYQKSCKGYLYKGWLYQIHL